jgi:hypothetical protein
MRTSGTTLPPNGHQKFGVSPGDLKVIIHYRHRHHNFVEKFLPTVPSFPFRKLNSHLKLGHSGGGDGYIVLVPNHVIEIGVRPLCIDQEGRVK